MADQTTGPRMLTSEEISEVCGTCRANSAIETWIKRAIRRYCHVNRLPMPVEDTDGVRERAMHELTAWFPADVEPVRPGPYERDIRGFGCRVYAFWDGLKWGRPSISPRGASLPIMRNGFNSYRCAPWRGVAAGVEGKAE